VAFTGTGNRKLTFRGGAGADLYDTTTGNYFAYESTDAKFNTFSLAIADGPGGATSLSKLENSTWLINGSNSFSGAVNIERGTLAFQGTNALGSGTATVTVSQASDDGRVFLDLRGVTSDRPIVINGGGNNNNTGWGASLGTNIWNGSVNYTGGAASLSVLGANTELTINGVVSSSVTINKVGNGRLVLAGNNNFTTQFNAMGGTVQLNYLTNNTSKLGDAAVLQLGGTGTTIAQGSRARSGDNVVFQRGARLEVLGGTHVETVGSTSLSAGASVIARASGDTGNAAVNLAGITANAGGTIDVELPVTPLTGCTLRQGSTAIECSSTAGLVPGMLLYGPGIPAGAVVASVSLANSTTFNMNYRALSSGTGVTLSTMGLTASILTAGVTTSNSSTITAARNTTLALGMNVVGSGIPAGAAITSINQNMTVTNSANSTADGTGLAMRVMPTSVVIPACTTTLNSTTVTTTANFTNGLSAGMLVTGTNLAPGTTIASITNTTTFVLSTPAIAAGTAQILTAYSASVPLAGAITTTGDDSVTCDSTTGLIVGMPVFGPNVPTGATVAVITGPISFDLSVAATGSASSLTLYATHPVTKTAVRLMNVATTTTTPATVNCASTTGLAAGMAVSSPFIPAGARVATIVNGTQFTLVSGTGVAAGTVQLATAATSVPITGAETTSGQTTVICANHGNTVLEGMLILGPNTPSGSVVTSVPSQTSFVINQAATGTATGQTMAAVAETLPVANVIATNANANLTTDYSAAVVPGVSIFGVGVPNAAKVNAVAPITTLGLSTAATASASGQTFTVPAGVQLVGTTSGGSPNVTVASTQGILPGMHVTGTNIPAGTRVASITNATTFVLTARCHRHHQHGHHLAPCASGHQLAEQRHDHWRAGRLHHRQQDDVGTERHRHELILDLRR